MNSLRVQIEQSARQLQNAWTAVQSAPGTVLPSKCYAHWTKKAVLYQTLGATSGLFLARDRAWEAVQALTSPENTKDARLNLVNHGPIELDFSVARHLTLTSYIVITWSIYDRLSNICGRLTALTELSDNPKQNPKVCEDFLGKKDTIGFGAHLHLRQAYTWPLKVSYKLRNWFVHEGYQEGSIPLFKGDQIADGFILHPEAVSHLQNICDYKTDNGLIDTCCLADGEEHWAKNDILTVFEKYHSEIDIMFTGLLKWSVDSFTGQITAFAERDKAALSSVASQGVI